MEAKLSEIWRDADSCYTALTLHDARFDGRFFVGVSSTGIYCRPVCQVRTPKRENCHFYPSPAAAESAGFRPCRRCRPELAPGLSPLASGSSLAGLLAQRLEERGDDPSLTAIARQLNTSDRRLRRVFRAHYGVSPQQYRQTARLLAAKSLLTDTGIAITEIAFASGFASLRAFNTAFRRQYGLPPQQFRKTRERFEAPQPLTVALGYRPPLDWQFLLSFLQARAIPGVEMVAGQVYRRTLAVEGKSHRDAGWLEVRDNAVASRLEIRLSPSLLMHLPRLLTTLRYVFDLHCLPQEISPALAEAASHLGLQAVPDIRLPGCFDGWEMAVRAILGQQITVAGARTLIGRVAETLGQRIDTPWPELSRCFPTSADLLAVPGSLENHLGPLGITSARSRCLAAIAGELDAGRLRLARGEDPTTLRQTLLAIPGIGRWTADYLLMRMLSWPDVFLESDAGVKNALRAVGMAVDSPVIEGCRPWRSYLTMLLWRSLAPR
jgi:AraC family transcriptional regulator, regulatory protein of adaptative response / DNA-3-methyladenine glycosylase II